MQCFVCNKLCNWSQPYIIWSFEPFHAPFTSPIHKKHLWFWHCFCFTVSLSSIDRYLLVLLRKTEIATNTGLRWFGCFLLDKYNVDPFNILLSRLVSRVLIILIRRLLFMCMLLSTIDILVFVCAFVNCLHYCIPGKMNTHVIVRCLQFPFLLF